MHSDLHSLWRTCYPTKRSCDLVTRYPEKAMTRGLFRCWHLIFPGCQMPCLESFRYVFVVQSLHLLCHVGACLNSPAIPPPQKPRRNSTFSESLKPTSASSSKDIFLLVVWNIFHFPFHIWHNMGCHLSHWLSYVSRWLLHHQPVFNAKQKSFIRNAPRDDDEEADDSPSSGAPGGGGTLGGEILTKQTVSGLKTSVSGVSVDGWIITQILCQAILGWQDEYVCSRSGLASR